MLVHDDKRDKDVITWVPCRLKKQEDATDLTRGHEDERPKIPVIRKRGFREMNVHSTRLRQREYEVEEIIGQRSNNGVQEFLVKWAEFDGSTWIPETDMNCEKIKSEWFKRHIGGQ